MRENLQNNFNPTAGRNNIHFYENLLEVEIERINIHPHDAESKTNVYETCSRVEKFVSIKVSSGLPVHHNY